MLHSLTLLLLQRAPLKSLNTPLQAPELLSDLKGGLSSLRRTPMARSPVRARDSVACLHELKSHTLGWYSLQAATPPIAVPER